MSNQPELGAGGKVAIALSLTAVGGFIDAVGYIALFQVFTANMSGNSVHVGMYLGRQEWSNLLRPLCAIVSYVVGMTLTRITVQIAGRRGIQRIASFTLTVEAVLLIFFARATPAMHLGQIVDLQSPIYFTLVALLAFAMGVQTATLTHVGALTIYTTFVTGTLTKLTESFTRALFWAYDKLHELKRISHVVRLVPQQRDIREGAMLASTWSCYVVGAAIGTVMKQRWELRALYIPVVIIVAFIAVDQFRPIDVDEERHQTG
ncbi:MAG: YoaK family protein [Candidatus Korobacteraceae bacterium]